MPPKRKTNIETSQVSNSKKHKLVENISEVEKVKEEVKEEVKEVKEVISTPTVENVVKKRGRKPKVNKVVTENSNNLEETATSSRMQSFDNSTQEKSVPKPRKPRAKKQAQEIHHDPLSIENLLIHQEHETVPIIPDVNSVLVPEVVTEKKPRKPRTKKQPQTGPLAIDNLLIHTSESIPVNQDSIDVSPSVKKSRMVRNGDQPLGEDPIHEEVATSSKSHEITLIPQELPMKKPRKPRTKKQEIPVEHSNVINIISNVQPETVNNSNIHQVTNVQIKPDELDETSEKINKFEDIPSEIKTSLEDFNTQITHVNEPGRKMPTKRGRPRKVDVVKGPVNENDNSEMHMEEHVHKDVSPNTKRGRPRKEKSSEISPDVNNSGSPINIVNDESTQKASSKRGRPKKTKQIETISKEEHSVKSPTSNISGEKEEKRRRGRPKKDNNKLTQDTTSENVLSTDDKTNSLATQRQDTKPEGESQSYYGNSLDVLASVSVGVKKQNPVTTTTNSQEKIPEITRETTEKTIVDDNSHQEQKEKVKTFDKEQKVKEEGKGPDEKLVEKLEEKLEEKDTIQKNGADDGVMEENRRVDEDETSSDDEQDSPVELTSSEIMKKRLATLQRLRERRDQAEQINRKETYDEHQRKKINTKEVIRKERKREEAEKLIARQEAEEKGEDFERKQFWNYSVDEVEKWEKKQEKKHKLADIQFTDYNQVARKKYKKLINNITPDISSYNEQKAAAAISSNAFYRDANSLQYAGVENSPSKEAIDRLTEDVNKQIAKREKFSRQKPINDDDDITYINERNRRFNDKIGRFYDKYTQEIRENFERGTAL